MSFIYYTTLPWEHREITGIEVPSINFSNVKITFTYDYCEHLPEECLSCFKNKECSIPIILKLLQELLDVYIRIEKCGMKGEKL